MKNAAITFVLLLFTVFIWLSSCGGNGENPVEETNNEPSAAVAEPNVASNPQDEVVYTSILIDVQIPGKLGLTATEDESYWYNNFEYDGGEVAANLILRNGHPGVLETMVMIVCDGLPVPYSVENMWDNETCGIFEVEGEKAYRVRFTPEFPARFGRIDFILVARFDENTTGHITYFYTIKAELPEWYETPDTNYTVYEPVPLREELQAGEGVPYVSWAWKKGYDYSGQGQNGGPLLLDAGETEIVAEAMTGIPGKYHLTFYLNNRLVQVYPGCDFIEFTTDGLTEMFTAPINLEGLLAEGYNNMFSVAVPVDEMKLMPSLVSQKTNIIYTP